MSSQKCKGGKSIGNLDDFYSVTFNADQGTSCASHRPKKAYISHRNLDIPSQSSTSPSISQKEPILVTTPDVHQDFSITYTQIEEGDANPGTSATSVRRH